MSWRIKEYKEEWLRKKWDDGSADRIAFWALVNGLISMQQYMEFGLDHNAIPRLIETIILEYKRLNQLYKQMNEVT